MSLKTLGKINRLDRKSEQTFKFHGIELIENAERSEWLKKKPRYDKLHAYRNANQQWNESVERRGRLLSRPILSVGDAMVRRDVIAPIAPIPHGRSNVSGNAVNPTPVEIAADDNRPPRFPYDRISNDGISRIRRRINFPNCSLPIVNPWILRFPRYFHDK